jgi:hypothetical protein
MSQVDVSTPWAAEQERQDADRADSDATTQQERVDEGRFHKNEERTRDTGGA